MSLNEGIKVRIKNIDFERVRIRVFGKGGKGRETLLPAVAKKSLKQHLVDI